MRLRPVIALMVLLALLAAACGSSSGDRTVGAVESDDDGRPSGFVSCELSDDPGPDGEELERIDASPAEDVPSALDNRTEESFPDPLVDLGRIISGGPPPDGIPSIDEPKFVPVAGASHVADCEPVVVLELDGQARAYPIAIMTRHEIVNDILGDVPVAVTFCPLCNSAIVFERTVDDQVFRFGVSGLLRNLSLIHI